MTYEPDGIDWGAADCHFGDHSWMGSGQCVRCYERLRCYCGQFVREDNIDRHLITTCPIGAKAFAQLPVEEQELLVS